MHRFWKGLQVLYARFMRDRCTVLAASLAYSSLLTLMPLLLVLATVASYLPFMQTVIPSIQKFIFSNFVAAAGEVVVKNINVFLHQLTHLSWTTLLSFTAVSLLFIYNLVRAFNTIWHVRMERHLAINFIIYFVFLLVAPVLFGALVFVSSYVSSLSLVEGHIRTPLLRLLPYISAFVVFSFFHWVMPSCRVRIRYALISGFVTMLLFEIARFGFVLYLRHFPTYRLIYGALAVIPIFLVWIYLSWLIILVGAVLCRLLHEEEL